MAERYHKNASCNSTVVLPPFCHCVCYQGSEQSYVRLPDELPSPELQKHRKKDPHPPAARNGLKGPSQRSDPIPFQRYAPDVRYLLLYLILLTGGAVVGTVSHHLHG